ncbi:hypothetical protein BDZ45DRAFT_741435 [Acephala macrosclerotiorum]|nr:hypothetical protein BDZ45DRAFT_741435 [Acephala macrosclerotiorum]
MVRGFGVGVGVIQMVSYFALSNALTIGKIVPETNHGPVCWSFAGCYTEGIHGTALPHKAVTTGGRGALTVHACTTACQAAGYTLAGVEYAKECCKICPQSSLLSVLGSLRTLPCKLRHDAYSFARVRQRHLERGHPRTRRDVKL